MTWAVSGYIHADSRPIAWKKEKLQDTKTPGEEEPEETKTKTTTKSEIPEVVLLREQATL